MTERRQAPKREARLTAPQLGTFPQTTRFSPVRLVGEGGTGVVYEAIDQERGTRVALKTLRAIEPESLFLLKNEFRALQDLRHENLVRLGELLHENDQWFFTMELVQGDNLLAWVRGESAPAARAAGFDETRLRSALGQLARGLSALHDARKVHLDVKPANVLVTAEGRVVLLDFGIGADLARNEGAPRAGIVGTPQYMAPEQAASERFGPAADWYAVGVVLYEALTGQSPFAGDAATVMERKILGEPPPPRCLAPDLPADLDELCTHLLRLDPDARPTGAEVLRRLHCAPAEDAPAARDVFVGRSRELLALRAAFEDVRAGHGVTVIAAGASGVGKSYLVQRFADGLAKEDTRVLVLRGRCYERESAPYKALDGIVDALAQRLVDLPDEDVMPLLPAGIAAVRRAFPVLGRVPAVARAPEQAGGLEPQELRARLFEGLRDLLGRVARQERLVVVRADLQWADADSMVLLATVLRVPAPPPMLLVATRRLATEPRAASPQASLGPASLPGDVRVLAVEPLSREDAGRLAASLATDGATSGAELSALVDEANGHPLFLHELVRQRRALHGEHGEPGRVLRLDDALWARAARLASPARHLLTVVSLAGVPITHATAARAAELDAATFDESVAVLRASHFVSTTGARRHDSIEPYHDRVRESVTARLDASTRRVCHERLARALEEEASSDLEAIAVHWQGAGDRARAAELAVRAAGLASQALAFDRAARLYRFALELRPELRAEGPSIDAELADALANAGRGAEAADAYLAAAGSGSGEMSHEWRRRAAEQLVKSGHLDRGFAILDEVLARFGMRLGQAGPTALASLALRRAHVRLRGLSFRPQDARDVPREELARIDACWSVAMGLSLVDTIRGADFQARHLLLALRAGEPYRIARAFAMEAAYANFGTAGTRGEELAGRAVALARSIDNPHADALAQLARAQRVYLRGGWRRAYGLLTDVERIVRERCTGASWELNNVLVWSAGALTLLGDLDALAERLPRHVHETLDRGDLFGAANLRLGLTGITWLAADDLSAAARNVDDATQNWPKQGFYLQRFNVAFTRAEIDLYAGDGAAARARVLEVWPLLRRAFLLEVQFLRVVALHLRGRTAIAAAATASGRAREELLRDAARDAAALAREDVGFAKAFGGALEAGVAAARGAPDAAQRYDAAARALESAETFLYAAAARWRAGELRGGVEGDAAVAAARAWLAARNVIAPPRLVAMLTPEGA